MRVHITPAMAALVNPSTNENYVEGEWAAVSQTEAQRLQATDQPDLPPAPPA